MTAKKGYYYDGYKTGYNQALLDVKQLGKITETEYIRLKSHGGTER